MFWRTSQGYEENESSSPRLTVIAYVYNSPDSIVEGRAYSRTTELKHRRGVSGTVAQTETPMEQAKRICNCFGGILQYGEA